MHSCLMISKMFRFHLKFIVNVENGKLREKVVDTNSEMDKCGVSSKMFTVNTVLLFDTVMQFPVHPDGQC